MNGPLIGKVIGFRGDSILANNKLQPLVCGHVGGTLGFNVCGDGTRAAWNLDSLLAPGALASTDILVMEHGINDWQGGQVLGTIYDPASGTGSFYARLKEEYNYVFTAKPTIRVIRTTPTKTFTGGLWPDWQLTNSAGHTQADYANAIKEVSALYSVPVLDLFNTSNLNFKNEWLLLTDHLHWTDQLYERIAIQVASFAEANF